MAQKQKNPLNKGLKSMVPHGRIELPAHPYHGCVLPLYQCGMHLLYQNERRRQEVYERCPMRFIGHSFKISSFSDVFSAISLLKDLLMLLQMFC